MRFEAILKCRGCQQKVVHVIRSKLDAGIVIQLAITCQECGSHDIEWFSKKTYQNLFINKIPKKK